MQQFKNNVVDNEIKKSGLLKGKYVIKDKYKVKKEVKEPSEHKSNESKDKDSRY